MPSTPTRDSGRCEHAGGVCLNLRRTMRASPPQRVSSIKPFVIEDLQIDGPMADLASEDTEARGGRTAVQRLVLVPFRYHAGALALTSRVLRDVVGVEPD